MAGRPHLCGRLDPVPPAGAGGRTGPETTSVVCKQAVQARHGGTNVTRGGVLQVREVKLWLGGWMVGWLVSIRRLDAPPCPTRPAPLHTARTTCLVLENTYLESDACDRVVVPRPAPTCKAHTTCLILSYTYLESDVGHHVAVCLAALQQIAPPAARGRSSQGGGTDCVAAGVGGG